MAEIEKIDSAKVLRILEAEHNSAIGAPGGQYANERAEAMDRYLRQPYGNEEESFSEALTSETADVVDSLMPSLMRMFLTADNLVMMDPTGPDDIEKAEQESRYLLHVFFKENPAFIILFFWMWDALVQKIGVVMAWWDDTERVSTETYTDLTIEEVDELLDEEGVEPMERDERPMMVEGQEVFDPQGEPVMLYDLKIKRTEKVNKACVEPIPPEQYRISSDASAPNGGGRMEAREFQCTRSDLIKRGFSKKQVMELDAVDPSYTRSEDERARKNKLDDTRGDPLDESMQTIMVRDSYIEIDYDGDGVAELRQVYTAGGDGGAQILRWEEGNSLAIHEVDRRPFHVLSPYLLPHKVIGQGVYDKVGEIQDTATHLLRQVLTNLYHTNNPGHGVSEFGLGENTLDDLLTTKVGRVVRFAGNPNEHYTPMSVPFTAGASFPMMEFFDKQKRDRTGVGSDGEGFSPDALKHVQQSALAQAVDLSKMKQSLVAQTFAETGMKSLFLHLHELLQKNQDKEKVFNVTGNWVTVKPTAWRTRYDLTMNIGLGIGTREQNLLHLNAIREMQSQIIEGGGLNLLVTPRNVYNTAREYVKNANMNNANLFFTDPGDQLAPPIPTEQDKLQKQQQELQARQQQLDAERQQIANAKHQLQMAEAQMKHQRELMGLDEKRQKREDDLMISNEKLRNELVELQQKNPVIAAEVDRLIAETDRIRKQGMLTEAQYLETLERARAQDIENDLVESGVGELLDEPIIEDDDDAATD